MNNLQVMFNKNIMQALVLEIAELEAEMANTRSKLFKNKQRAVAIAQKKEAINQIEELSK